MQPVMSLRCNLHLNTSGLAATLGLTAAQRAQLAIWEGHAMSEGDLWGGDVGWEQFRVPQPSLQPLRGLPLSRACRKQVGRRLTYN